MKTTITDDSTVEKIRGYLANLQDNDARVAAINAEADAVALVARSDYSVLWYVRLAFQVEQEYFTYVSTMGEWYVRAATVDEQRLIP